MNGRSTVVPWCPTHEPVQYRNALPPKCDACGFDRGGRAWAHIPGTMTAIVVAVADGVEVTESDHRDMRRANLRKP